ncbi:hypothetical protein [Priestia megaterium]|uniref:hypothetical protein n=1 Tax=Priestia megaterium TaxID=1404 RepID=UPI00112BC701|nr:hypothetical protein [Priestia megaterium]TPF17954.1 hypothetical protein CBE78_01650 [Priestia megaterium]TPF22062.1 hypothetical protein CBE79_04155 [Priestia megaterium]
MTMTTNHQEVLNNQQQEVLRGIKKITARDVKEFLEEKVSMDSATDSEFDFYLSIQEIGFNKAKELHRLTVKKIMKQVKAYTQTGLI